uniref:Uncharacterized protein n=1 Tax=Rhizophora mucronata TaxID=61149 RepID=A0A2P2PT75_RHIMU
MGHPYIIEMGPP